MASFNKVILVGNLTRDPEVRYIPSGTAVADVGLAVNRTWFDKQTNTRQQEVTFVDVTLWARTAEVAGEYLSKGSQVLIEGRLQMDQWDDRETGQKRSKLKVICENMTMLGSRPDSQRAEASAPSGDSFAAEPQNSAPSDAPSDSASVDTPPTAPPDDNVPF